MGHHLLYESWIKNCFFNQLIILKVARIATIKKGLFYFKIVFGNKIKIIQPWLE